VALEKKVLMLLPFISVLFTKVMKRRRMSWEGHVDSEKKRSKMLIMFRLENLKANTARETWT